MDSYLDFTSRRHSRESACFLGMVTSWGYIDGKEILLFVRAQILCQALGVGGLLGWGKMERREGEDERERRVGQADTDGALAWGDKQKD